MHPQINHLMGLALDSLQKENVDGAQRLLKQVLVMIPKNAEVLRLLGVTYAFQRDLNSALKAFDSSIKCDPKNYLAYSNRGNILTSLQDFDGALKSYNKAIELQPNYAEAHNNKGNLLQEMGKLSEAVACYDRAIELQPNYAEAFNNAGNTLKKLNALELALVAYDKALEFGIDITAVIGQFINCKMQLCDWSGLAEYINRLNDDAIFTSGKLHPFYLLPILDDPLVIRQATEAYMLLLHPDQSSQALSALRPHQEKIRIGYFSPDFRNHPVSYLIAGLIEHHDKNRFELIAFSMGPGESDEMRLRLMNSFDQFIDVSSKSDKEVASMVKKLGVDIAIDLGGLTQYARPGIFSYHAAPVQIGYIGYLGTMSAPYYDYIIADDVIVPPELSSAYSEKILYLPTYQANDPKRAISTRVFSRAEFGIPEDTFVYCCFNNNYKFTPSILDSWVKILSRVNKSIIFLHAETEIVKRNLLLEFRTRGIEESRVFFAERLPRDEYLSRYRIADLFLDTSPYNAGTTASDALWAGLPVITFLGKTFSARMGGSILNAVGLPELVCASQKDYEDLAVSLGLDSSRISQIKEKLANNLLTSPLFDAITFANHFERALVNTLIH